MMFPKIIKEKIDWYLLRNRVKDLNKEYREKVKYEPNYIFDCVDFKYKPKKTKIYNWRCFPLEKYYGYDSNFIGIYNIEQKRVCELPKNYQTKIDKKKFMIDYNLETKYYKY